MTPLVHGGGQERDIRCGTLDIPASRRSPPRSSAAVKLQAEHAERARRRCATTWSAGSLRGRPRRRPATAPRGRRAAARQRPPRLPGLRGRLAADAARRPRHRVLDRVGLLGRRPAALATCCSRWAATRSRRASSLRFSLGHTSSRRRRRRGRRGDRAGRRAGRGAPASTVRGRRAVRVVAAMSGGVDSAVAAARAVEAGHDVTGIHLALSRNPASYRSGARGCCTIEDANDARRAADVIGIPFYVWDLSRAVPRGRGRGLHGRVRRRPHPQPVPALQREDQVRRRARPGARARASTPSRPATTPGCAPATDGAGRDAPRRRPRQGPVLRARGARPGPAAPLALPARRHRPSRRCARRRRGAGCSVADKPDSHDICFVADGDNAGWLRREARRPRPNRAATSSTPAPGEVLGEHGGTLRLHHRSAQGAADRATRGRRQAAVRARHRAGHRHRHGRPARASWPSTGSPGSGPAGAAPSRRGSTATASPCSCARTAPSTAPSSTVDGDRVDDRAAGPGVTASPPARRSSSTTAPASSAPPPSTRPDRVAAARR